MRVSASMANTILTNKVGIGRAKRQYRLQTTGFGTGGAAGVFVGGKVVAGLTAIGLGLTPVGWVVLIGIGITVGFGVAYGVDQLAQNRAAYVYDRGWE